MSEVTGRYSTNAVIRKVLLDAQVAVNRAKDAVSIEASSGKTAKVSEKYSDSTSETPDLAKPERKLSAAGRKAIGSATKKRLASKREETAALRKGASKKNAGPTNATAVKKATLSPDAATQSST